MKYKFFSFLLFCFNTIALSDNQANKPSYFLGLNYFTAGFLFQKPAGEFVDRLSSSHPGLFLLEYASTVHDEWWLGFGLSMQPVSLKDSDQSTQLIALHEKVSRIVHLYDRWFGIIGGKLLFIGLYQNDGIKIISPKNHYPEIGGAITAEIFYSFSPSLAFGLEFDLFRGFKTSHIQGSHVVFSAHCAIP